MQEDESAADQLEKRVASVGSAPVTPLAGLTTANASPRGSAGPWRLLGPA